MLVVENQEHYTAPRMVLAASGVDHEELISVAEPLLSDLPSVSRPKEPNSNYHGGDFRCQGEAGVSINFQISPHQNLILPRDTILNKIYGYLSAMLCCNGRVHILLLLLKCLVVGKKRKMLSL